MEQWENCHPKLLAGDYDENWPAHEWIRTGNPEFNDVLQPTPTFEKPIWDGRRAPITLLINADFGMGDTIHFWRFVLLAKERVFCVIVRCDDDFITLFPSKPGIQVIGNSQPLPHFTHIIHMMALPRVLGIKKQDISGKSYISVSSPVDFSFIKDLKFTKIGVCWQGNPFNQRDNIRSIPEEYLKGLFVVPGMKFFSLNKIGNIPEGFFNMKGYLTSWNTTANLLECMDLVISVDTAVAHLAGAMGIPTWLIVPVEQPDWRWGTEGDKTIWYDSIKIFRRDKGFAEVIDQIAKSIIGLMSS